MTMPQPTQEHSLLGKLAGRWEGSETMPPSQWDPHGGKAMGLIQARPALNGFALISDYRQARDGITTYEGHGVWTYDANEGVYVLHWFDSMGSPPEVFKGTFDKEVLTVAHGGPGMHARLTYEFSEPHRMKSRMEMSSDGKEWSLLFEGLYEKK